MFKFLIIYCCFALITDVILTKDEKRGNLHLRRHDAEGIFLPAEEHPLGILLDDNNNKRRKLSMGGKSGKGGNENNDGMGLASTGANYGTVGEKDDCGVGGVRLAIQRSQKSLRQQKSTTAHGIQMIVERVFQGMEWVVRLAIQRRQKSRRHQKSTRAHRIQMIVEWVVQGMEWVVSLAIQRSQEPRRPCGAKNELVHVKDIGGVKMIAGSTTSRRG